HKLIREWVKYLPEVIDYLNNYPTRLIRAPGSSKWGLAPIKAIKLEKVESRPSTKYKRPVGKNEENKLKKGDNVRYLLANAEWEGGMENQKRATDPVWSPTLFKIRKIVVTKNEPILYYLEGDEFTPKRGFVKEELLYVNIDTLQYPPQSILEENTRSRSINFVRIINKMSKAVAYAERRGGECRGKTGQINAEDRSLYPTLFVNKFWYSCAGPIIWRCAVFDKRNLVQFEKFKKVMRGKQKPLYHSKLLRLILHECKISDRTLIKIACETSGLKCLILNGCNGFSYESTADSLKMWPNLKHLEFDFNNTKKGVSGKFIYIDDRILCGIAIRNLEYLSLGSSKLSDKSLSKIADSCPNLNYLSLGHNKHITDISMIDIAHSCPKLRYLSLWCCSITDETLKAVAYSCPGLQHLRLMSCGGISDVGVCAIATSCRNIIDFSFESCGVSDISVKKIAQSCPSIRSLNLDWCYITDESICEIARSCPRLEVLLLLNCFISDISIHEIIRSCKNLRSLDLKKCYSVTDEAIDALMTSNPRIDIREP
ncbi:4697_t:CDS:2, partial [Entrophospora sp. SA101]